MRAAGSNSSEIIPSTFRADTSRAAHTPSPPYRMNFGSSRGRNPIATTAITARETNAVRDTAAIMPSAMSIVQPIQNSSRATELFGQPACRTR